MGDQIWWSGRSAHVGAQPIVACDEYATVLQANLPAKQIARRLGASSVTALLPGEHSALNALCLQSRKPQIGTALIRRRRLSWTYRRLRNRNRVCAYGTLLTEPGTRSSFEAALLKRAMANLAIGVLVVDADLDIHYANRHAQTLLEASWPDATKEGRLFHAMPWLGNDLRAVILQGTGAVVLQRNGGKAPIEFVSSRISDETLRIPNDRPLALFLVVDPETVPLAFTDNLRSLYGFSPAEARVASVLKRGPHLDDVAKQIGVSRNTIRTQLKMLCEKTGTGRMSDLLWRLNTCAAAFLIDPDWLSRLNDFIQ